MLAELLARNDDGNGTFNEPWALPLLPEIGTGRDADGPDPLDFGSGPLGLLPAEVGLNRTSSGSGVVGRDKSSPSLGETEPWRMASVVAARPFVACV